MVRSWSLSGPLRAFFMMMTCKLAPPSPAGLFFCGRPRCHSGMAHSTNLRKREAEAKFPYKVDVPIPMFGLGNRLNEML